MTSHRCWVYGDNVNTDVIFPGKYTYTLKTPEDIAAHALEDLDSTFVTSIKYCGVNLIIAASFSGLYFRNCINQGVLPIVCAGLNGVVKSGDSIEIDLVNASIVAAGKTFTFPRLSPSVQAIMDAGGLLPMLQHKFASQASG